MSEGCPGCSRPADSPGSGRLRTGARPNPGTCRRRGRLRTSRRGTRSGCREDRPVRPSTRWSHRPRGERRPHPWPRARHRRCTADDRHRPRLAPSRPVRCGVVARDQIVDIPVKAERAAHALAAGTAHLPRPGGVTDKPRHRVRQGSGIAGRNAEAGHPVDDRLAQSTAAGDHDRALTAHRLQRCRLNRARPACRRSPPTDTRPSRPARAH